MPSPLVTRLQEADVAPAGGVHLSSPPLTPLQASPPTGKQAAVDRQAAVNPRPQSPTGATKQAAVERQAAVNPPPQSPTGATKQAAVDRQAAVNPPPQPPQPPTGAAKQAPTEQQKSALAKPPAATPDPPSVTSAEARRTTPAGGAAGVKPGGTPLAPAGSETAGADARRRADEEAVERVVQSYADAYTRLDARMAKSIWPEVDEIALGRAFSGLAAQEMVLEKCAVTLDDRQAVAECGGRTTYVTRVGSREPRTDRRRWTFVLRPAGDSWRITAVTAR